MRAYNVAVALLAVALHATAAGKTVTLHPTIWVAVGTVVADCCTLIACVATVRRRPSFLAWVWAVAVNALLIVASFHPAGRQLVVASAYAIGRLGVPHVIDVMDVLFAAAIFLVVCGPLLWLRFAPPRTARA